MEFEIIEEKHKQIINIAKEYIEKIDDVEHDINHTKDVVKYTKKLVNYIMQDNTIDIDACIIGAYWHDVGRSKVQEGHEKESAEMLKKHMIELEYNEEFIKKCYDSIEFHKWNMNPKTIEGLVIKDADKIAWVGSERWEKCIKDRKRLDEIINLLPKLRNEILYFEYSKKIYDVEVLKIVELLYNKIYEK